MSETSAPRPYAPRVETFRSLAGLEPLRRALDALNLAARRPSPFHSIDYLEAHLASDEFEPQDWEALLLVAFDGDTPVGFLPLRRRTDRGFGRRQRIELLTTHDTERPSLVARPEDEARCAEAFLRWLTDDEHGWSLLELMEQDADSPLAALPGIDQRRFYIRRLRGNPSTTIQLQGTALDRLAAEFEGWHWKRFARRVRALRATGSVEFVACEAREAAPRLLDLYLELELRSWKPAARAGISRHPRRVELFRRMLALQSCDAPLFHFLLVDGVPIAGWLSLQFDGMGYGMETAYDAAYGRFDPGNLLFRFAIRDAIVRGLRGYDLLTNFTYFKDRWGAAIIETAAVQVHRRGSRYHLRARLGDLRRRLFGTPLQQVDATRNLSRPHLRVETTDDRLAREPASVPEARGADVAARRAFTAAVLAEVERTGALTRLSAEALVAALPFEVPARKPGRSSGGRRRKATT